MPDIPVPVPGPSAPSPVVVRTYYCTACGLMYMEFPPDRICLGCHSQYKFKQVDMESPNVTETVPA